MFLWPFILGKPPACSMLARVLEAFRVRQGGTHFAVHSFLGEWILMVCGSLKECWQSLEVRDKFKCRARERCRAVRIPLPLLTTG